jgi:hypothetical protein
MSQGVMAASAITAGMSFVAGVRVAEGDMAMANSISQIILLDQGIGEETAHRSRDGVRQSLVQIAPIPLSLLCCGRFF